jgi:hypothetical protein
MSDDYVTKETEDAPAMEMHLGEARSSAVPDVVTERMRRCIIWLNGKRWEGDLVEVKDG